MNTDDKIKNIFDRVKQVYAVDVEIGTDDVYSCRIVKLFKQGAAIDFAVPETCGNSFEDLCREIPKQAPLCLLLNGKGIIYRRLTVKDAQTETDLIKTIIPNAKPDDFYLQQYTIAQQDGKSDKLFAIARKSLIDKVVSDFNEKFDFIVDVSISPFVLDDILPVIQAEEIHYKNFLLRIKQQKTEDFSTADIDTPQTVNIGGNTVHTDLLPALGLGFSFLLDYRTVESPVLHINDRCREYIYRQKTVFTGKVALVSLLVFLLANFMVFDHYYKKVQSEQLSAASRKNTIDKLKQLKDEYDAKSRFLQQSGLLEQDRISLYLDKLAATVPANITLTDLQVNPLANPTKQDSFDFTGNLIRVSGTSIRSSEFNEWIKRLKADPAFAGVSIITYEHDLKTNRAAFTITLKRQ